MRIDGASVLTRQVRATVTETRTAPLALSASAAGATIAAAALRSARRSNERRMG